MITTEYLLTSLGTHLECQPPHASVRFVASLTVCPLVTLASDPDVIEMVGGRAAIASLPTAMPFEVIILAGIRAGRPSRACARPSGHRRPWMYPGWYRVRFHASPS